MSWGFQPVFFPPLFKSVFKMTHLKFYWKGSSIHWFPPQNVHVSQCRARPNLGAWSSASVSGRVLKGCSITCYPSRCALAGCWTGKRSSRNPNPGNSSTGFRCANILATVPPRPPPLLLPLRTPVRVDEGPPNDFILTGHIYKISDFQIKPHSQGLEARICKCIFRGNATKPSASASLFCLSNQVLCCPDLGLPPPGLNEVMHFSLF